MLQWILGRFDFSQNEFQLRLAKNRIEEGPLKSRRTTFCENSSKISIVIFYLRIMPLLRNIKLAAATRKFIILLVCTLHDRKQL